MHTIALPTQPPPLLLFHNSTFARITSYWARAGLPTNWYHSGFGWWPSSGFLAVMMSFTHTNLLTNLLLSYKYIWFFKRRKGQVRLLDRRLETVDWGLGTGDLETGPWSNLRWFHWLVNWRLVSTRPSTRIPLARSIHLLLYAILLLLLFIPKNYRHEILVCSLVPSLDSLLI